MADIDPKYECDAPLYVDFEQLKQNGGFEDDGADSWFGMSRVCVFLSLYWLPF